MKLTKSEQTILDGVTNGAKSIADLATLTGKSAKAIKSHLTNVYRKFNVKGLKELRYLKGPAPEHMQAITAEAKYKENMYCDCRLSDLYSTPQEVPAVLDFDDMDLPGKLTPVPVTAEDCCAFCGYHALYQEVDTESESA